MNVFPLRTTGYPQPGGTTPATKTLSSETTTRLAVALEGIPLESIIQAAWALLAGRYGVELADPIPSEEMTVLEWLKTRRPVAIDTPPVTAMASIGGDDTVTLTVRSQELDDGTTSRMVAHWATLLDAIACTPSATIASLPMLDDDEQRQLLAWNPHRATHVEPRCIHEMFEERARRAPDAVALVFEGRRISYRELDRRSNAVALRLREAGVGPGIIVGVLVERSPELIVALLGVLKAGGAYLPFDPQCPADRVRFMLDDARVATVIVDDAAVARIGETTRTLVAIDAPDLAAGTDSRPSSAVTANDLAYVIYTSGSTGQPKGVMVGHRHVSRLFTATEGWFGFDSHDVWTLFHSAAFDFSVWEIWGALLYGGSLVIVPYFVSRSPAEMHELLCREKVTVLNQTPSAFRQLIAADESSSSTLSLRTVIFGGEALDIESLRPWFDRHGDESPRLVNMYGITETTVHVTYRPISKRDLDASSSSVIGHPIPDLRLYLLDAQKRLVPAGVPGEIHVGGEGVAFGYLNRPELTTERFIDDPFSEAGGRLYRSGDLARFRPDGDLEYLGRIDHQVKIRGFRIELGEIETAIVSQPSVREAVVLAREDTPGDRRLVAYVVLKDATASTRELRDLLARTLPDYMVPSAFVTIDAVPLTTNGKVDKRALPTPADPAPEVATSGDGIHARLTRIWAELLAIESLGPDDDFFELGAHSMLIVDALHRIETSLGGVKLSFRDAFLNPTVNQLAVLVAAKAPRVEPTPTYARAFDLMIGDELATFYLTQADFERDGLPTNAINVRTIE